VIDRRAAAASTASRSPMPGKSSRSSSRIPFDQERQGAHARRVGHKVFSAKRQRFDTQYGVLKGNPCAEVMWRVMTSHRRASDALRNSMRGSTVLQRRPKCILREWTASTQVRIPQRGGSKTQQTPGLRKVGAVQARPELSRRHRRAASRYWIRGRGMKR